MFRIRIDVVNDLNSDQIIEVCRPDTYVIVRHELPTGNPHYHAYFKYDSDFKDNTLRQRLKRKFGFLKPSDYSIKKCDEERSNEYVQYMFNTKHGNKWELIDVHNFDNKLIDDLKEAAKKISTDFDATHKREKSKGPTIWDIAQEVDQASRDILEGQSLGLGRGRSEDFPDDSQAEEKKIVVYTDLAIHVLRKHHKAFDEYLLRKIISTAMSSTEYGKQKLRLKMIKNFSQHY